MSTQSPHTPAPRWTLEAFRLGAVGMLPLLPGLFAFGMAFGTVAARKGFTLFETVLMSATVFAGMSQVIVVESWPERLTLPAIASAALVAGMVGMRFLLIGASLRPWLGTSSALKVYPTLYLLTEPNWLLSMRYRADGGGDPAFLLGSGVIVWIFWVAAAAPGYWLGAAVADPTVYGLDLVMPDAPLSRRMTGAYHAPCHYKTASLPSANCWPFATVACSWATAAGAFTPTIAG